ncbi:hypothetical protein JMJ94_07320 [Rhodovulum visakhapatnamense]|uniref:hypothetical protein n=1 Tax=Rhodovulum visakhapatnamense TaxID=364297 RepID=UPI001921644D|nr:hypothetical protein [Rhodovulum visakhapatnamense]MBL3569307.1 hypothetical protein [Rhodovulum visakhapatnamense]
MAERRGAAAFEDRHLLLWAGRLACRPSFGLLANVSGREKFWPGRAQPDSDLTVARAGASVDPKCRAPDRILPFERNDKCTWRHISRVGILIFGGRRRGDRLRTRQPVLAPRDDTLRLRAPELSRFSQENFAMSCGSRSLDVVNGANLQQGYAFTAFVCRKQEYNS